MFRLYSLPCRLRRAIPACWTRPIRLSLKVRFSLLTSYLLVSYLFLCHFFTLQMQNFLNSHQSVSAAESSMLGTTVGDRINLEVETHIKFSVWVSFCEIYNENIHDLLEVVPSGAPRRTALRLSQDVKGNAFVKGVKGWARMARYLTEVWSCTKMQKIFEPWSNKIHVCR